MMEFAVVVILHDPGALAIGPVEQGKPALDGERHAQRELMGGRHERERGVRGAADRGGDVEPSIIDPYPNEAKRGLLQQIAREEVSGVLAQTLAPGGSVTTESTCDAFAVNVFGSPPSQTSGVPLPSSAASPTSRIEIVPISRPRGFLATLPPSASAII